MWIERSIETLLRAQSQKCPAVVLTGCRQAGKTSLLRHLWPDRRAVSLDLPQTAEAADESGDTFLQLHPIPLVIDEVQHAPKLWRYLKAAIDAVPDQNDLYLLTGSQKFSLMRGVSESLAGRAAILNCYSLSAKEVEAYRGRTLEGEALTEAIYLGGYPGLHARDLDPVQFFSSYVATYLERDVRQVLQIRSLRDFDRFLRLLALRNGQLLSAQALAAETGVSGGTIKAWLAVLEGSNIVLLLPPYHRNLGKRLVKTPKIYFMDTGLACYLSGLRSPRELQNSALLGPLFETYVAGQIVRHFANRGAEPRLSFYRDQHGREVDFVVDVGEQLHLLECKWNANASLKVAGFAEVLGLIGEQNILSRTVVTSCRGYTRTSSGVGRGDALQFHYLDPHQGPPRV